MRLSSVDINNPAYNVGFSVKFDCDKYTETMQDDEGNDFQISIAYDYYFYDGAKHVAKLSYDPKPVYYMTDESMRESVKESLTLAIGYYVLDCTPEKYEPKYPGA
jgi:hypothetical protein